MRVIKLNVKNLFKNHSSIVKYLMLQDSVLKTELIKTTVLSERASFSFLEKQVFLNRHRYLTPQTVLFQ